MDYLKFCVMTLVAENEFKTLYERLEPNILFIGTFAVLVNFSIFLLSQVFYLKFPLLYCLIGGLLGFWLIIQKRWFPNLSFQMRCIFTIISMGFVIPYEWGMLLFLNSDNLLIHMLVLGVLALYSNIITLFWLFPTIILNGLLVFISLLFLNVHLVLSTQMATTLCGGVVIMFILSGFDYRRRHAEEAYSNQLKLLAGGIAHEVTTPVSSILSVVRGIERYFPVLIDSYQSLIKKNEIEKVIPNEHLILLKNGLNSIKTSARDTFLIMDMFLFKIRKTKMLHKKMYNIGNIVNDAIHSFSMTDEEKKLINFNEEHGFETLINDMTVKHIIYNLLKNALFQIRKEGKGTINIRFSNETKYNILCFEDTASGISPEDLEHIFDEFFTKKSSGTGLGLSFCKTAMKEVGGEITCSSCLGEYTEFKLKFPKTNEIKK